MPRRPPVGRIGEIPGRIGLTKFSSNQPPYGGWTLRIEDSTNGTIILESTLTAEQFTDMFSGQTRDTAVDLGTPALWGALLETKTEYVEDSNDVEIIRRQAKELEYDGWMVRDDYKNMHRRSDKGYAIHCHRYMRDGKPVIL